ncbi:trypsin-like peptidase domain-containing protein [Aerococcaceae bacterium DSM 111020]|nr:trypsin-like peptidase domain-containing protein [Aerococcaceae bacterium DSM 111020]
MKEKYSSKLYQWRGMFLGLVLGIALVFGLTWIAKDAVKPANSQEPSPASFEETITSVVDKTQDAVVSVGNYQVTTGNQDLSPILEFYGYSSENQGINIGELEQEPQLVGTGSGVVYKIEGDKAYVVTNNHVIEDADKIEITLRNEEVIEAELVGADALSDLAVLTIPSDKIDTVAEFADSDQLKVGQIAIAIGSPIGQEFATSVTQGIVSGLNRSVPVSDQWNMTLLQTDAAINPGNSGGALLNSQGQLIGINSSKFAASAIEGMGFAIPANDVVEITQQLEQDGEVKRPSLGVALLPLAGINQDSRVTDLGLDPENTDGMVVMEVTPGSAADQAGVQQYDVIVGINDVAITDFISLRQELFNHQVGDTIQLKVIREGKEQTIDVELTDNVEAEPEMETYQEEEELPTIPGY